MTETFSYSGEAGEPLPAEGGGYAEPESLGPRPRRLDSDPEDRGWQERARSAGGGNPQALTLLCRARGAEVGKTKRKARWKLTRKGGGLDLTAKRGEIDQQRG